MKGKEYKESMKIGLAGDYLVAGMLSIKGWYASLTLKNYPGIDIIAHKVGEKNNLRWIQVKSTKGQSSILVGRLKRGATEENVRSKIVKGDYIFVVFDQKVNESPNVYPDYYIVPMNDMVQLVLRTNEDYFNKKHEKEVAETQPVAIIVKSLEPYKDRWDLLDE